MYKKMDVGERAAKLAELARQLGILEAVADGPLLVEGAGGPTTADAALFPTLCFCKSVRIQRAQCCSAGVVLARAPVAVMVPRACCAGHLSGYALPPAPCWGTRWGRLLTHNADRTGCACTPLPDWVALSHQPPRMQILPTVFGWEDIFKSRPKLGAYFAAMQADEAGARVRARARAPSVARA